ncbi:MAG: SUMF1/EgtB/PvdO family nonheme iron enzyme [Oleispira sp.]|nr:SUMF1/EgtB/PvdO family nonheme iron enzyme [Oleispira sp.]MBL4882310.1 SUMF1/EgtB/PvdO family nonheme iron enzyme [Oleispira sp.]
MLYLNRNLKKQTTLFTLAMLAFFPLPAFAGDSATQNLSAVEQQLQQAIDDMNSKSNRPIDTTVTESDKVKEPRSPAAIAEKPRKLSVELQTQLLQEMIFIEGGNFEMGSSLPTAANREKPAHQVTLDSFYIGKTEVTQKLFEAIMGWDYSYFPCATCPVNNISWFNMQLFIERLNQASGEVFRLPTEAEWAYAAKGGQQSKGYIYSGSDNIDDVAWYAGNAKKRSHPVATKNPNELGLYDMTGNLWEFCQDTMKRHLYTEKPRLNPLYQPSKNLKKKTMKVLRGSGYEFAANESEVFRRDGATNNVRMPDIGFRLAMSHDDN